ncbi:MAG: hypothetical protein HZB80_08280 [Deltaproteobacteria bacterium]|nr:hypothetical protein [Deltaproteobacteria bacterium]
MFEKEMKNLQDSITWSEVKLKREELKSFYPTILKVPIIYGTKKQIIRNLLINKTRKQKKMLDLGAADRFVKEICSDINNGIEYKSMDTDRSRLHDYYSLDEIQERFDIILLLDVIEHLPLPEGKTLLLKCSHLLNHEGKIVITIPNNCHPSAFSGDCTHITSYRYHDLGGLLLSAGFEGLQIFRVSAKRKLRHRLLALILKPILKFLDIDFAAGILITAKKAIQ